MLWEEQQTLDKRIQNITNSVALGMLNSCKGKTVQTSVERCAFNISSATAGKISNTLVPLCMSLLLQKLYSYRGSLKYSRTMAFDRKSKIQQVE